MPGHIKELEKNKKYEITIESGIHPSTGNRRRIKRTFHGGIRDARKELSRLEQEVESGTFYDTSNMTMREYLTQWLEDHCENSVAATTYRRYSGIVKLRIIPKLGQIPLDKLKPPHIQKFFTGIIKEGRLDGPHKGEPLSQESLTYHYRVLHRAMEVAKKQQLVPWNVVDSIDIPRVTKEIFIDDDDADAADDVKFLTGDEVQLMLEHAKDTPYYALLFLAVRTGMRRGELLGLRWQDVDLQGKIIKVRQSLAYTPEKGLFYKPPKNKKSRRTIDITSEVIDVLKQHKKEQAEAKLYFGQAYDDRGLVFCQRLGPPMHPDTPSSWFPKFTERTVIHKPCDKLIGKKTICPHCEKKVKDDDVIRLPRLTFHCLRHTHASLMLQTGVDIKVISDRLGHSSIRITYDLYSHLMPGKQKEAAEALENLLKK